MSSYIIFIQIYNLNSTWEVISSIQNHTQEKDQDQDHICTPLNPENKHAGLSFNHNVKNKKETIDQEHHPNHSPIDQDSSNQDSPIHTQEILHQNHTDQIINNYQQIIKHIPYHPNNHQPFNHHKPLSSNNQHHRNHSPSINKHLYIKNIIPNQ